MQTKAWEARSIQMPKEPRRDFAVRPFKLVVNDTGPLTDGICVYV